MFASRWRILCHFLENMAEGGCTCNRCTRRGPFHGTLEGHLNRDGFSMSTDANEERNLGPEESRESEIQADEFICSNDGTSQATPQSTFASLTRRLSRAFSFSRLRGSSVEATEQSENDGFRSRRNSDKRKSWSGFRRSGSEYPDDQEVASRESIQSRRSSWYEKFRRALDYKPNEENAARNVTGAVPRRPPPREPFSFPLTEEEFQTLRREPRIVDRSQDIKMEYFLVPDLLAVTNCPWYWGKINRYQAEKVLDGYPDGTFLLRDSAQFHYLFSVSFRRYSRTYHARIEHWKHQYGFDKPGERSFYTKNVCDLVKHYSHPEQCMYYEPLLLKPLPRKDTLPLQHLCRGVICSRVGFQGVVELPLPKMLKSYLREYHYRVSVRRKTEDKSTQTILQRRKFGVSWS